MKVIQCQNQKQKPKSCDAFVGRREMSSPAEAPTWGRALEQSCPVLRMRRGSQEVGAIWPLGCTFAHRAQKSRNLTFTPPTGGPQIHGRSSLSREKNLQISNLFVTLSDCVSPKEEDLPITQALFSSEK